MAHKIYIIAHTILPTGKPYYMTFAGETEQQCLRTLWSWLTNQSARLAKFEGPFEIIVGE